jgi:hypothetical protein
MTRAGQRPLLPPCARRSTTPDDRTCGWPGWRYDLGSVTARRAGPVTRARRQGCGVDERTDPVEIIARVDEPDGRERAFGVWIHKATKAGWTVTVVSTSFDRLGTECGVVDVDGLPYRIHHGRRVRQRVGIVAPGRHLIAAAVDLATGEQDGITWTWDFSHAAWAEPILADQHE